MFKLLCIVLALALSHAAFSFQLEGKIVNGYWESTAQSIGLQQLNSTIVFTLEVLRGNVQQNGTFEFCAKSGAKPPTSLDSNWNVVCDYYYTAMWGAAPQEFSWGASRGRVSTRKATQPAPIAPRSTQPSFTRRLIDSAGRTRKSSSELPGSSYTGGGYALGSVAGPDLSALGFRAGSYIFAVREKQPAEAKNMTDIVLTVDTNDCPFQGTMECPTLTTIIAGERTNVLVGPGETAYFDFTTQPGVFELTYTFNQTDFSPAVFYVYEGGYADASIFDQADGHSIGKTNETAVVQIVFKAPDFSPRIGQYVLAVENSNTTHNYNLTFVLTATNCLDPAVPATGCPTAADLTQFTKGQTKELTLTIGVMSYFILANTSKIQVAAANPDGSGDNAELYVSYNDYPSPTRGFDYKDCTLDAAQCTKSRIIIGEAAQNGTWFIGLLATQEKQTKATVWISGCADNCGEHGACSSTDDSIGQCACTGDFSGLACTTEVESSSSSSGLSTGIIVLIAIGSFLVASAVIACIAFMMMRAKKRASYDRV